MKFTLHYTDKRHRYHAWFGAYISFSKYMGIDAGPLSFCQTTDWFTEKYGPSCEVRQWFEMKEWQEAYSKIISATKASNMTPEIINDAKKYVNPHWSWSNGTEDLRVYICSDKELTFFNLSFENENT